MKSAFLLCVPDFFVVEKPSEKMTVPVIGKWKRSRSVLCVVLFSAVFHCIYTGFSTGDFTPCVSEAVFHTCFTGFYSTECGIRVRSSVFYLHLKLFYLALEARIVEYHFFAYLNGIYNGGVIPVEICAYLVL